MEIVIGVVSTVKVGLQGELVDPNRGQPAQSGQFGQIDGPREAVREEAPQALH